MDPCYSQWADWIEDTWAASRPASVLDLCCGTGLMTAQLVEHGHRVVGVDASEAMLARARARLGTSVPLLHTGLPDLPIEGPFDAAVSSLDGLNYLGLEDLEATFVAVARVLRPGGWLVFDVHGPGMLPFARANPVITGVRCGCSFVLTTDVEGAACRTTIDFTGDADHPAFTETHTQHMHTVDEIRAALTIAGFSVLAVTDEYSDAALAESTLRATWVARRESR